MKNFECWLLPEGLPSFVAGRGLESEISCYTLLRAQDLSVTEKDRLKDFLKHAISFDEVTLAGKEILARVHHAASVDPKEISLAQFLDVLPPKLRIESWLVSDSQSPLEKLKAEAELLWREPAIEFIWTGSSGDWWSSRAVLPDAKRAQDPSMDPVVDPSKIGLEFSKEELAAIADEAKIQNRNFTRTEWELLAQTWSEHCKHKIFGAEITAKDARLPVTKGIFKTYLRAPALKIADVEKDTYLSLFHDNSGVVGLTRPDGSVSPWAACIKMETHNSPSAISPYGGASTGLVGVHRDILGTGLGAKPIASWDVLCFESTENKDRRPKNALPPDVIRRGVIHGIEDGGNQSGIPTVQGSVVFHNSYSAKPLVYAGAIGSLKREDVDKKAKPGDTLYCVGGAVGADGLRGAVMSSRDLRTEDFQGSAVQVAQAFVQRCLTEFLLEARDLKIISCVTDNGAGGLASSCGEMATLTNGARIDLSNLRFKFRGLHSWEKLLSESQERMTVATRDEKAFEDLANAWGVGIDKIGELNDSKNFVVSDHEKTIVDLSLDFLHEKCPTLKLTTQWAWEDELKILNSEVSNFEDAAKKIDEFNSSLDLKAEFKALLNSEILASREGIVRRFDHEVQGRTKKLPFAGATQESPQDGSLIEVFEDEESSAYVALGHGLAPYRQDINDNVLHSVDESIRQALLGGMKLNESAMLDNYSWPDPLPAQDGQAARPQSDRLTWKLLRSAEILESVTRHFGMPFISGKDSMKNTSEGIDVPETLVVSSFGPSYSPQDVPHSFFTRANDVCFYLEPLQFDLRGSALERFKGRALSTNRALFDAGTFIGQDESLESTIATLKKRYQSFEKLIANGYIRAAKDIGEGGLLTSVFEMCLGRHLGMQIDMAKPELKPLFSEGLGGLVFTCDIHQIDKIEKAFTDLKRIGVVTKTFDFRFTGGEQWQLDEFRESYLEKTKEGFWG